MGDAVLEPFAITGSVTSKNAQSTDDLIPLVIALSGEIDASRAGEIKDALRPAMKRANVVIDLHDVPYVDSSFIAVMIAVGKVRKAKGFAPTHIAGARTIVQRVLKIFRLNETWPTFKTVNDALIAFWA